MAGAKRWERQAKFFTALAPFLPRPPELHEPSTAIDKAAHVATDQDQPRWWAPLARFWEPFADAAMGFQPGVAIGAGGFAMRFDGPGGTYEFDVQVTRSGLHITSPSNFSGITFLEIDVLSEAHGSNLCRIDPDQLRDGVDIVLDFDPWGTAWGVRVRGS